MHNLLGCVLLVDIDQGMQEARFASSIPDCVRLCRHLKLRAVAG